jgi:acyl dehydratase
MNYNEFVVGLVLRSGARIVTGEEIIEFASQYDPQSFHTDATKAKKTRWGGSIASG